MLPLCGWSLHSLGTFIRNEYLRAFKIVNTMKLGVPKELKDREKRVALSPEVVKDLVKKGFEVLLETGAGLNSFISGEADVILKVNAPLPGEIAKMKKEAILISFMFAATNPDLVDACEKAGIS